MDEDLNVNVNCDEKCGPLDEERKASRALIRKARCRSLTMEILDADLGRSDMEAFGFLAAHLDRSVENATAQSGLRLR